MTSTAGTGSTSDIEWPDGEELEVSPGRPAILHVGKPVTDLGGTGGAAEGAAGWAEERADLLSSAVLRYGALLIRGLEVRDASALGRLSGRLSRTTMREREAFGKRRPIGGSVLSSLEWPPDEPMCMHHELSYTLEFPRLLVMGCFEEPSNGGTTGLADARAVLEALPPSLVERFSRDGWQLVRSYNGLVGIPWQEAFQAQDRATAEAYCRDNAIEAEWQPDGGLCTVQRRAAVIHHPLTGDPVWFNQIAFLNEWTMDPGIREYLTMQFGAEGLPFNSLHGNGEPLTAETVALLNDVYEAATLREKWRAGDVLLVDNIRMAHSREPYEGRREVGMVLCDPVRLADCRPVGLTGSAAGR
ncbi:TauD/TfdA family dioxygenase [Streptomyces sp. NPDC048611]|uniref:TauD/TfdA family dioxygenase n=1 Tax=Streptomyces sp. NPDC048611 TaxID=3155635 RepID=UPI0034469D97